MKAIWMSMILSSVGALCPSMAQAGDLCAPFFENEYAMNGRITVEAKALRGPKASEYAKTIQYIDSLLGTLKAPSEANIVIHDMMIFSNFNQIDFTVYVGLRPGELMGEKHPGINMTTLTHEYGHAIFEKNLRVAIPNFTKISNKMHENSDDTLSTFIVFTGLHELFADTVTLVATKNPEAISDLTSIPRKSFSALKKDYEKLKKTTPSEDLFGEPEGPMPFIKKYSRDAMSLRNMKDGYDHRLYQKWQELMSEEYSLRTNEFPRLDPYLILMPARWHLWQVIKTRVDSENYQQEILSKVFPILKKEMALMLKKPLEKLSASDVEMLNYRIMKQLDEALL